MGDVRSITVLGEHCLMQNISTKERGGGAFETAMGHLPLFLSDETAKTNVPPSKAIHADFISTFCRPSPVMVISSESSNQPIN